MTNKILLAAAALVATMSASAAQAQTKYMMRQFVTPKQVAVKPTTTCGPLVEGQWCAAQIPGQPAAALVKSGPTGLSMADAAGWCTANKDPYMIGVCMMQTGGTPIIVSNCRIGYVGSGAGYNASNCQ